MTETDEALAREWLAEDEGPYVGEMDNVGYHRARKAVEDTRVDLLASLLQRVRTEERQRVERIVEKLVKEAKAKARGPAGMLWWNGHSHGLLWMRDEIIRRLREG